MGYCTTAELEDRLTAALLNRRIVEAATDRIRILEGDISTLREENALLRRRLKEANVLH